MFNLKLSLFDLLPLLPEIIILAMLSITLMAEVFFSKYQRFISYYLVQLTLIIAFITVLYQFLSFSSKAILFNGETTLDLLALLAKLFIYLFSFFGFLYARFYLNVHQMMRGEYYLLGLCTVLGMSIMASAYSLLTIYLGLELLSLSLYAMVAINKKSQVATEAAMKYFVLGAFASGLLLYGISLLYGATGHIQLNSIATVLLSYQGMVPLVGLIFILGGLLFKLGVVPFHMWVPDVYEGASTSTTLLIAGAPKIAAFVVIVRIVAETTNNLSAEWVPILTVVAVLSMFLGNVLAIVQTNFKRLLAYSSIAHMGYTLLGILAGPTISGGYSAAFFYIATYVLVTIGAFAIISALSKEGMEYENLEDYRGLNARNPWLAFMLLLILFSMAGVPPTVGFFAKLGLLTALIQGGFIELAVLALLFALIGAYYYLRVVMLMYFEEPPTYLSRSTIVVARDMKIAISLNGMAVLMLGIMPSFLIDLCRLTVGS